MSKFTQPWGWSKLDTYRGCPRRFYYQYVEKLPSGKPGPALVRGARIHDDLDMYVKKWDSKLPAEAIKWKDYVDGLRDQPSVTGEQGLGFDKDWTQLPDWFQPSTWLRVKIDAWYTDGGMVKIVDWKTGKYRVPSSDQLKLYAAAASSMVPDATTFVVEMPYIDQHPKKYTAEYTKADIPMIKKDFENEVAVIYRTESWPTKPSRACRYCPYSRHNGGPCEF